MTARHLKTIGSLNASVPARPGAPKRVDVLAVDPLYRGYFSANRYTLAHETFAGGLCPPITREVFERGHAVAVLPYDPARDRVVLIEQFRAGAMVAGWHPWLIEVPAGMIEPGEAPEDVARRETGEEVGLPLGRLEFIAHVLCTPGASSETLALYCGEVCAEAVPEHGGLAAEAEDIRIFTLPAEAAIALLDGGRLDNASTLMMLQWFALNRARLRSAWLADKEDR